MKIIKGADRAETHWTARQLIELMEDGTVNFNIDIQRGYVWKKNDKRSEFIRTLIMDDFVPPLYFNKIEDTYEGVDGKQRAMTIKKFLNDEFALSDLETFLVENEDGSMEEIDINGCKFSQLPAKFQNAVKDYNFTVCYKDNADQSEEATMFYNLNNGQSLNAATMNRVKAKSKDQIIRLSKHKLFSETSEGGALTKVAIDGHVNDDLVAKAHAILNKEDISTDAKWIRPYMREAVITKEDEKFLDEIFTRIYNMHAEIEDKKIAKRIYARTHLISIVPVVAASINEGYSDKQMAEWFIHFFCGKKSPSISKGYNDAAGRGTGKNSAIRKRLEELRKDYEEYSSKMKDFPMAS